jgi:hypothetical protein
MPVQFRVLYLVEQTVPLEAETMAEVEKRAHMIALTHHWKLVSIHQAAIPVARHETPKPVGV